MGKNNQSIHYAQKLMLNSLYKFFILDTIEGWLVKNMGFKTSSEFKHKLSTH